MGCDLVKVQNMRYRLPLDRMVSFLDMAAKNDAEAASMLASLGRPVLEVPYEELISDEAAAARWWGDVLQFIGISREDAGLLTSEWRRQIVKSHLEVIENYSEVKAKLTSYRGGIYLKYL